MAAKMRDCGSGLRSTKTPYASEAMLQLHDLAKSESWPTKVGDGAADRLGFAGADGLAGQNAVEDFGQVMTLGGGAVLAEVDVAIVDAATVDPFPGLCRAHEDSGLGRDDCGGASDEAMSRVRDGRHAVAILAAMSLALRGGGGGIRVDEPEAHPTGGVLALEAGDFGSVAIGDGAIGPGEKKHDGAGAGVGEGVVGSVDGEQQKWEQGQHHWRFLLYRGEGCKTAGEIRALVCRPVLYCGSAA